MTIVDINRSLTKTFALSPISLTEWEIKTTATFQNGENIKVYLVNEKNSWYITDKKTTLKNMNQIYDLKAADVKNCIASVIKIYGFTINAGALKCEISDEVEFESRIFDYIMCIGQLVNMYAFFDNPE